MRDASLFQRARAVVLLSLVLASGSAGAAQLPPAAVIPNVATTDRPNSEKAFSSVEIYEGGNTAYMTLGRGYYDQPGNRVYDTPTILRDTVIVGNRVHGVKRWFPDGGAIYHLSADPGALIAENHVYDVPGGIGVYLDEGSRYVTVRDNVFDGLGLWVNLNALDGAYPRRTAADNVARGNWHNGGKANGSWSDYANNRLIDYVTIEGQAWPAPAREVIARAGPRAAKP